MLQFRTKDDLQVIPQIFAQPFLLRLESQRLFYLYILQC
jgi:hypothetical protein